MKNSVKQMSSISSITEEVFLSGVTAVASEDTLTKHNITHSLNLARELQDFEYPVHVECLRVSLRDASDEDLYPRLHDLVDHIHQVVGRGGRIVVHCVAGISRSASVCIAYLVKHHEMTLNDAYHHVLDRREVIHPNNGFWQSLVQFEEDIRGSNSVQLMPFVLGMVPSVYEQDTELCIKRYWMDELCLMFLFHLLVLTVQTAAFFFM
ncbi:dual specificity protein phosphatase 18-like [Gigantopelta aegis]|uniref:dual specificity protein phosphatase 18-like n=1 Tax=Gigantopelta aegis TaxID=1735272 RepID=UPI001B88A2DD|nr:dual specificity protein phosphatase 18-like [Gigantopelta aegis]